MQPESRAAANECQACLSGVPHAFCTCDLTPDRPPRSVLRWLPRQSLERLLNATQSRTPRTLASASVVIRRALTFRSRRAWESFDGTASCGFTETGSGTGGAVGYVPAADDLQRRVRRSSCCAERNGPRFRGP